jgi:branched-chain amino acid transport system ATP-binding protein
VPPADDTSGGAAAGRLPGGAALAVSAVSVRFGGVLALDDVSLEAAPGHVTGLIGPNGAGKTTLFNVVSGLHHPDHGSVHLFGRDVTALAPPARARLGLARTFQRLELFGSLTVEENVLVGLESTAVWWHRRHRRGRQGSGTVDEADRRRAARAARILAEVGLTSVAGVQASTLPTGLARMAELARALAIDPRLLLLDEPGSGLDRTESEVLGDLLVRLASSGVAVLLVEHDMELVMRVCDPIHVLDFGHVIASGAPAQVRGDPAVQAAYLGAVPDGVTATGGGR